MVEHANGCDTGAEQAMAANLDSESDLVADMRKIRENRECHILNGMRYGVNMSLLRLEPVLGECVCRNTRLLRSCCHIPQAHFELISCICGKRAAT